jgi:hypothetical protein
MLSSIVFSILKSKIKKIILIFFCHMVIRVDTWCERFTLLYWKGIYINVWNTSLGTDHLTWRGGLWFFVSVRIFFSDNTRVGIIFFLSRHARNFFPEFNIRLYDKSSESEYFFSLHQNQNIFFSNIGNQNIFLGKNHNSPIKLNGRSLIDSAISHAKIGVNNSIICRVCLY